MHKPTYALVILRVSGQHIVRGLCHHRAIDLFLRAGSVDPAACVSIVRESDGAALISSASVRTIFNEYKPQFAAA